MNQPIKWSRLDLLQRILIVGAAGAVLFLCAPYFGAFFGGAAPQRQPAPAPAAKSQPPPAEAARPTPASRNLAEIEELLK